MVQAPNPPPKVMVSGIMDNEGEFLPRPPCGKGVGGVSLDDINDFYFNRGECLKNGPFLDEIWEDI